MSATLHCPRCGGGSLLSNERAAIGYPITATKGADGRRDFEYTGATYTVYDEGTAFADEIVCTSCGWDGTLSELTDAS